MNNQLENKSNSEEINLEHLLDKTGEFIKRIVKLFFLIISFFQKYIIVSIILIIVGVAYGFYKDKKSKKLYVNEVIVIPNFESVDYLYSKVDFFNSKINIKDTLFLKTVLDTNYINIKKIEIEPIVDVYNFASQSKENFDIFRILFVNQELSEFVKDMTTSKYYKYHKLKFYIFGTEGSELIVGDLINFFNDNPHYQKYKDVLSENTDFLIIENSKMIAQVDSLIAASISFSKVQLPNQSVNINDWSDFSNLILRKDNLLNNREALLKVKEDQVKIIKEISVNYNFEDESTSKLPRALIYPMRLLLLFSFTFFAINSFRKLKKYSNN